MWFSLTSMMKDSPTTVKMTTQRNEIDGPCDRVPEHNISQKTLTGCMSLNSSGRDQSMMVRIHLTRPKHRTFHLSLSGVGLNCSPIGGIAMSTVSNNGDLIRCKALIASNDDELVTCPYQCKCPDVCSNAVAHISKMMAVSLCKISGWNVSTTIQHYTRVCHIFP